MVRLLRRDRGFRLLVVALLGLGIGSATLVFSVVNEMLLKPLPVRDPGNLYVLARTRPGELRPDDYFSERHYREVVLKSPMVGAAVAEQLADPGSIVALRESGTTRLVQAQIVSPNYFHELGVRPLLGRLLDEPDASATGTLPAVLSYHFWQSQYRGDRSVLGRTIHVKNAPFTIVGVLPREFHSSDADRAPEVRLPRGAAQLFAGGVSYRLLIRLVPGVDAARAGGALLPGLRAVDATVAPAERRSEPHEWTVLLQPIPRGVSRMRDQFAGALRLLLAGVALLLLAVCANVAGLLIAKSAGRRREIGIRLAVGASRWQVVRQLLGESLALALAGAAAGGAIYWLLAPRMVGLLPPVRDLAQYSSPQLLTLTPDWRVLAFAASATLFAVLAAGLAPALRASKLDLVTELKAAPGQRTTSSGIVPVAIQVAFAMVLLSGAGLMARTWWKLDRLDAGFDRERVVSFTIDAASAGYNMDETGAVATELRRRVAGLAGVRSTAWAWRGLMRGSGIKMTVAPQGVVLPPATFLNTSLHQVTPGYFDTLGLRRLAGRDLRISDADVKPTPVVVNQAFAAQFFPGGDPVGKQLASGKDGTKPPNWTIVGVVSTAKYRSMREPDPPTVYQLFHERKGSDWQLHLHVRTDGPPASVAGAVRKTLRELDPGVPLVEVATLDAEVRASLWQERLVAILAAFFGAAAVTLAGIGLYGALALSVAERRRELGIRVAVGAQARHVASAVCEPIAVGVACGIAAGLLAAGWLLRLTRALLFGVEPFDPVSALAAVGLVAACSLLAAALPVRRAMRVDPAPVLREG